MPKRSNEFQHLVALVERALRPQGIEVTESAELVDTATGKKREVDIVIRTSDEFHPVTIGVECRGGGETPRRATIEWVEQMWGKHSTLPTDKLVLVSKGGFSSLARTKARFWNIRTLSLSQAEDLDWPGVIRVLGSIDLVSFLRPYPTSITAIISLAPDEEEPDPPMIDLEAWELHDEAGSKIGTISVLVAQWLNDPSVIEEIERQAYTDTETVIEFERRLRPGVYLTDDTGTRRPVVAVRVEAKCRKRVSRVEVTQLSYGEAAISHGRGDSFGREVHFIEVHQPEKEPQMLVSVRLHPTSGD